MTARFNRKKHARRASYVTIREYTYSSLPKPSPKWSRQAKMAFAATAALAFHVPGNPRTYCVNAGRRLSQYDLWPGPGDKRGWDAIYVRQKLKAAIEPDVGRLFASTEQIHYETRHRGRPARRFTIYLCYDFNGEWPSGQGSGY